MGSSSNIKKPYEKKSNKQLQIDQLKQASVGNPTIELLFRGLLEKLEKKPSPSKILILEGEETLVLKKQENLKKN